MEGTRALNLLRTPVQNRMLEARVSGCAREVCAYEQVIRLIDRLLVALGDKQFRYGLSREGEKCWIR